jgi:hypothetical protein
MYTVEESILLLKFCTEDKKLFLLNLHGLQFE